MNFIHWVKTIPREIMLFLQLIRFFKPEGTILLFLPCAWTIILVWPENLWFMLGIFFLGSFLMRSAGCIINDLWDVDFDKHVERTKNRVLTSGKLSKRKALFYLVLLLIVSLGILLQFNYLAILVGFVSIIPVVIYPYMKRITNFPQVFLGFTFNAGVLLSWAAMKNEITLVPLLFYLACIVWTIYYDTIYAISDMKDDIRIGIKSTAIYLGKNLKKYLLLMAIAHSIFLNLAVFLYSSNISLVLVLIFINASLLYQIKYLNNVNTINNFKLSQIYGILILVTLSILHY